MNTVTKFDFGLNREYKVLVDRDGVSEINVRDILTKDWQELPWLVECKNCIYLVTNLVDNKRYVGQASYCYGRWVCGGAFTHIVEICESENIFNRALRKHKSRNFKLEILESDIPTKNLNEREIFWISNFKSFHYDSELGYNLTRGGGNCEQLQNPEVIKKRLQTCIKRYGSPMGQCYTPEAKLRNSLTRIINNIQNHIDNLKNNQWDITPYNYVYNSEFLNCSSQHIPNVLRFLEELRKDKRWNSEMESLFSYFETKGIPEYIWTDEDDKRASKVWSQMISNSSLTRNYNGILNHIEKLKSKGLEITPYNYIHLTEDNHIYRHLGGVMCRCEEYFNDARWTPELNKLFTDIYDYCLEQWPDWTLENLGEVNPYKIT